MLRLLLLLLFFVTAEARLPEITSKQATDKIHDILKSHASHKNLTPELVKRILQNYLEQLDPTKTYFIESDIHEWTEPSDTLINKILEDYNQGKFDEFTKIEKKLASVIQRRHDLEKDIDVKNLPKNVKASEFKDMKWVANEQELLERLMRIKALQLEAAAKLSEDVKDKTLQRIQKRQDKYEEEILNTDPKFQERFVLTSVLKAIASSLDTHTAYFTPDEATQFMINVQQRLFGIGAQLRDDINGFTVVKIIEGGPAYNQKELKAKDKIIAVNGEPVVGMDIVDAVELIRGEEGTPVTLTVIRETTVEGETTKKEEKLNITIPRGEVVLKETRYESSYEPFGDGVIAYLRLYTFYQDPESSSAEDLEREFKKIKEAHNVKGVILDLRYNTGGLLSQAVAVTGLFITKGVVVSIKDETGSIQRLRDVDGTSMWTGPLIVLTNRTSASASEIVAGTLQDYGRALIIGDDHTFGKGSFQTFTLNTTTNTVNPQGEFKVTRGRYYTVSGKTPQLTGVLADITVPGPLSESEIGERYQKNPLENDEIKPSFDDDLSDIPLLQREKIRALYKFNLQKKENRYGQDLPLLKSNSETRIKNNKDYQNFLKEIKKKESDEVDEEDAEQFGQNDLQLTEAYSIMKDLIILEH